MDVNGKEDVFQLGSISVSHVPAALINMNYLRRGDPLQTATTFQICDGSIGKVSI